MAQQEGVSKTRTATLANIHRVAVHVRGDYDSYLNCGPISRQIADGIHSHLDINPILVEDGRIRYTPRSAAGAEHAFVVIPREQIRDYSGRIIVDGTLDQFCVENWEEGLVSVNLGPRESFNTVDIVTENDERWGRFRWSPEVCYRFGDNVADSLA